MSDAAGLFAILWIFTLATMGVALAVLLWIARSWRLLLAEWIGSPGLRPLSPESHTSPKSTESPAVLHAPLSPAADQDDEA